MGEATRKVGTGDENIAEVGNWARDKLSLLREYITISSPARKRWIRPTSEATYIDLFCGPGKSQCRDTGELLDGSPVVAWNASVLSGVPFSRVFLADASAQHVHSAADRLRTLPAAPVASFVGPGESTVNDIYRELIPWELHFALLDPFNLEDLPFSVIERLAKLKHIDLMIHLSTGDMQRNYATYTDAENATLDRFAPGWRKAVDFNAQPFAQRLAIVRHWFSLLNDVGLPHAPAMHAARNSKNSRMYWLIFASRADIARKFWTAAQRYLREPTLTLF